MYLKDLIKILESAPDRQAIIAKGFNHPHSWRGDYSQLAFAPKEHVSIQDMLDCAKSAINSTYLGCKGGEFTMSEYSEVHISEPGESYDYIWEYWLDSQFNV